jgi:hypothetical protein
MKLKLNTPTLLTIIFAGIIGGMWAVDAILRNIWAKDTTLATAAYIDEVTSGGQVDPIVTDPPTPTEPPIPAQTSPNPTPTTAPATTTPIPGVTPPDPTQLTDFRLRSSDKYRLKNYDLKVMPAVVTALDTMFNDFYTQKGLKNVMIYNAYIPPEENQTGSPELSSGYAVELRIFNETEKTNTPFAPTGDYEWIAQNCGNYNFTLTNNILTYNSNVQ